MLRKYYLRTRVIFTRRSNFSSENDVEHYQATLLLLSAPITILGQSSDDQRRGVRFAPISSIAGLDGERCDTAENRTDEPFTTDSEPQKANAFLFGSESAEEGAGAFLRPPPLSHLTNNCLNVQINGRDMHWSVLPVICPYLDMRSLYALTAAYPQWAAMIFRQLKKKMTTVQLHLKSDVKSEYEVYWKVAKPQERKTENDEEYTKWVELSNLAWKFLSFDLMKVTLVRIDQGPLSSFPDEVYPVLGNIESTKLYIKFHNREEARKVLQAISDHCAPFLDIHDESREADKEPLIRKTLLANIRTMNYSGHVESLKSDLLAAMDAGHTFLSVHRSPSQPLTRWVANLVEEYLKAQAGNVCFLKRGPEGYEMKRNDARSNSGVRRIFVVNCTTDPRAAFDDIEIHEHGKDFCDGQRRKEHATSTTKRISN
ncbi:unnamed protein product [Heligmosomoides polygyrus]|uniref:MIT_C domain-containing protein n=1 Tax=Heligmosomoides polygyrus TaxID=6339 RepID=A0A3P8AF37_HELPZ|nr:unnamed protein product [Heligmosomoides polygyrus]